jgi:hypothetical protein
LSLYLDTSVIVPLHVEETRSEAVRAWIDQQSRPLIISDLAAAEFASALSRLVRTGHMTHNFALEALDDFEKWRAQVTLPAETIPHDIRLAAQLVREPNPPLLVPDAIHLATCQRLGSTLVTDDADLLKVADMLSIPCVSP